MEVVFSSRFRKDVKRCSKRGLPLQLLYSTIEKLAAGEELPSSFCDHALTGNYEGTRECHLQPDWLLIYAIDNNRLILTATRTGSHSDLF